MTTITIGHPFNMSYDVTTTESIDISYRSTMATENEAGNIEKTYATKSYEVLVKPNGIVLIKKRLQDNSNDGDTLHSKK